MITQAKQVEETKQEEQTLKSYMNLNNSEDDQESEMWTQKRDISIPITIQKEPPMNALDLLDNLKYVGQKGKP